MKDSIVVRGARQNNLKGFDIRIPRRALVVVTGPSGSGKSSLAFDTIYAEGQRRYVESLSAYARQFLERMEKPDVDSIDGLSPAVAIQQVNPSRSSRSTVGTVTEVYDYLRLLWARIGHTHCPQCGREITPDTVQSATDVVLGLPSGSQLLVVFRDDSLTGAAIDDLTSSLLTRGFLRVFVRGSTLRVEDLPAAKLTANDRRELMVIADRLTVTGDNAGRIAESIATSFREGNGECIVLTGAKPDTKDALRFSERFECAYDGEKAVAPTPLLFSYNSPRGACENCNGFGATLEYDESLIIRDQSLSLSDGALDPWTKPRYGNKRRALANFARANSIPMDIPWMELSEAHRQLLLFATARSFKGMIPFLKDLESKRYKQYIRVFLRQYQTAQICGLCNGARLNGAARLVRVAGKNISEVAALPVADLSIWMDTLPLSAVEKEISGHILGEARSRLHFLCDVGVEYLSLDRATRTLSGGEVQRITLANSIGSRLVDTLYVLDEPSIGLHSRDLDRLLSILIRLRDAGNSVLVVEHDLDAIRAADFMIELGPGSGEKGGYVVFEGPLSRVSESPLTGRYLSGEQNIPVPATRRHTSGRALVLTGVTENNLRNLTVRFPLGTLTVVTGVSGSGKSTLVHDVLYRALELKLRGDHSAKEHLGERVGAFKDLRGYEALEDVVLVDQSPIGRSARSNPITYIKAFDEVRRIFAHTPLAKQRKYTAGTFSFNVSGGRCDTCEGAGYLQVEMVFMADVQVPCDECGGKRFKAEVLDVLVNGRNIHQVLELTVDQAIRFFSHEEKLGQALWHLQQVGLGYLHLGQPATTLSGGEAQRVKIARELLLASRRTGRKLYIMDEPTTGLHIDDVRKLAKVLERLVDRGHSILLIEHNLDLIKLADWVIDLGPEGGAGGGAIVAEGTPEEISAVEASHTGRWLRGVLPGSRLPGGTTRRSA